MYTITRETGQALAARRCGHSCWAYRWVTSRRGKPVTNGVMSPATSNPSVPTLYSGRSNVFTAITESEVRPTFIVSTLAVS